MKKIDTINHKTYLPINELHLIEISICQLLNRINGTNAKKKSAKLRKKGTFRLKVETGCHNGRRMKS